MIPDDVRRVSSRRLARRRHMQHLARLCMPSPAEMRVLVLLARHGMSNQQIAERLYVTPSTVTDHIHRMLHKWGLPNRTRLALFALQSGFVRVSEIDIPVRALDATEKDER